MRWIEWLNKMAEAQRVGVNKSRHQRAPKALFGEQLQQIQRKEKENIVTQQTLLHFAQGGFCKSGEACPEMAPAQIKDTRISQVVNVPGMNRLWHWRI
jgi:hypothetical protein